MRVEGKVSVGGGSRVLPGSAPPPGISEWGVPHYRNVCSPHRQLFRARCSPVTTVFFGEGENKRVFSGWVLILKDAFLLTCLLPVLLEKSTAYWI